ncbi:MAG TPA: adenosine kinase [Candidatus Moranbacteria bacterium]|nr:adenosine kinase [Candidatus Moranbacteria bacterium]
MEIRKKIIKNKQWDILGIGSPLLDIVINVSNDMLRKLNFKKGSMNLISKKESKNILKLFRNIKYELTPGGSVSNTISGANILGSRVSFLGIVGKDAYGKKYHAKIKKEGIDSHLHYHEKDATGHVIVLVTPDGERTMATHLGASLNFTKEHIKKDLIINSRILHIEAYQLENSITRQAVLHAIQIAKKNSVLISLDLSDTELIQRNKKLFKNIIKEHIDIVFANEKEAVEFAGKKNPLEALHKIAKNCNIAIVKLGEKGSLIKKGKNVFKIKSQKVDVINTNGAGDTYAAGILHGLINNLDLQEAGEMASHISALVVGSSGARLDKKHINSIYKYQNEKRTRL